MIFVSSVVNEGNCEGGDENYVILRVSECELDLLILMSFFNSGPEGNQMR